MQFVYQGNKARINLPTIAHSMGAVGKFWYSDTYLGTLLLLSARLGTWERLVEQAYKIWCSFRAYCTQSKITGRDFDQILYYCRDQKHVL